LGKKLKGIEQSMEQTNTTNNNTNNSKNNNNKNIQITWMPQSRHKHLSQDVLFSLPSFRSVPLIFVCTGTGYAPIRSFLQHRRMEKLMNPGNLLKGKEIRKQIKKQH
jgi:hypothetical protein